MAIEQINSAAYDYDVMLATLEGAYVGKADITISAYDTTAAPDVKVGSKFEVSGALFKVLTADETPTGYAGISVSTTFYLVYDTSGAAFVYTEVAPTWNDALQGWYGTGAEANDRYFFAMYKDSGGTLYQNKIKLSDNGDISIRTKIIEIGDWDMDADGNLDVNHGLALTTIRTVEVTIRDDADIIYYTFPSYFSDTINAGVLQITTTQVKLERKAAGIFDGVGFDATSYNRGWIIIQYEV